MSIALTVFFLFIISTKVNNVRQTYRDFGVTGIVAQVFGFEMEKAKQ